MTRNKMQPNVNQRPDLMKADINEEIEMQSAKPQPHQMHWAFGDAERQLAKSWPSCSTAPAE